LAAFIGSAASKPKASATSRGDPAGLGLSTIVDFEKYVSRAAVHAMQKALEKAGIQFIAKDGGSLGCAFKHKATYNSPEGYFWESM
jgi:hypothetical protein